jgi:hypothetical protein
MPMNLPQLRFYFCRLGHWVQEQVVAEVPANLALCEFDCRQTACSLEEWTTCKRRISKAAEELMPCTQQVHTDLAPTVETARELVVAT